MSNGCFSCSVPQHHIDAAGAGRTATARLCHTAGTGFQILEFRGETIGSYHLSRKPVPQPDILELDMIMVEPAFQGQGFGGLMMGHIQNAGREAALPVQLNVLRTNPAVSFHRRYGFTDKASDQHSLVMIWSP
ncbi:MAG: GNAT family N-acetyltransferase [Pseudohongiellaceae bacterium]